MAILNPTDLSFNGEEIRDLQEATFEAVFDKPEFGLFHQLIQGIKAKKQIAILGRINGLTGKGSGGCDPMSNTNTITNSEKRWDPATVSNRFTSCWTELQETFFIWGTQNGIAKADVTRTDYFNFLMDRIGDALVEEVFRHVWFGDVDADTVSNGGVLTDTTDPAYFTKINGLWKQAFEIVAGNSDRRTLGIDSRNGQGSFAAQEFTDTDTDNRIVTKTLQNMKFDADNRLRGTADAMIIVTQSVADQYERELIDSERLYTTERLENGMIALRSGGMTVIPFELWDRIIREHYSDGAAYFLPHRAIMLVKTNTQVGTEEEGNLTEMNPIYDVIKKENHIDTMYNIDAVFVQDYLIQVAY